MWPLLYKRAELDLRSTKCVCFQVEIQLFKLFHNERRIKECEEESSAKRKDLVKIEKKKEAIEEKVKEAKKEHGKSQREFAKVDSDIREKENAIQKKRPAFIKAKEKTAHIQKKVDNAKKSLKQAEKAWKSHQSDVQVIHLGSIYPFVTLKWVFTCIFINTVTKSLKLPFLRDVI